jgi:phytol kinase
MSTRDDVTATRQVGRPKFNPAVAIERFRGEIVRKSLHFLIALVPLLASLSLPIALILLAFGTLFYTFAEVSRRQGRPVFVVSDLTLLASRDAEKGRFVLGPITLGLGAMLALILYPEPAASIAIFALAFGDGIASLAGKVLRGPVIPFTRGKTLSGTLACFVVVFLVTLRVTGRPVQSLIIGGTAAVLEAIPAGNFDNLVVPIGVGFLADRLLPLV